MKGRLVILSGPSAVGKDTLLDALIARDPRVVRVVTYTTRAPRDGETDGVDYHFVSLSLFFELEREGHFYEHKNVFGDDWYASPKTDTEALEAEGKIAVLKIDVEGALDVMAKRPDAITVFILPPSEEELAHRIRQRAKDSEEAIQRRLQKAARELSFAERYQRRIVNDDLGKATNELAAAIGAR